jgi:curved DNA-binding protein CbpA
MPAQTYDQLAAFVRQTYPRLEVLSYYDLLGLPTTANPAEIRAAFYRCAGDLHPDHYHMLPDREVKDRLETIYARMCEGYRVLSNPEKRAAYAKALVEGKRRLTSSERESHAPQNPEDSLKHEEAKKFFRLGMLSLGRKDWKGAVMNFNFARAFEPASTVINQKLAEAQAALGKTGAPTAK